MKKYYYFRRILEHICCNWVQKNSKLEVQVVKFAGIVHLQVNLKNVRGEEKDFPPYIKMAENKW